MQPVYNQQEWQLIEQQPTQPLIVKRRQRKRRALLWFALLVLCGVLVGGILIGNSAIAGWLSFFSTPISSLEPVDQPQMPVAVSPAADLAAQRFMDAMMQKDWAVMWEMLDPDAQQSWQGERDFIHFEQAKFGSMQFVSYSDSPISIEHAWRNPDTTQVYPYAAILSVSFELSAPEKLLASPSDFALKHGLYDHSLFALTQNHGAWQVLVAGPADLEAPILVPASPPTVKLSVPIFMYHHVSNQPTQDLLDYELSVTTTDFEQQLGWLEQNGYHSITQSELFDALYYGKALPAHPMILSFDDGYEDVYTNALPALLAHHDRGVFYIITGMIGGRYMTWDQVRTLASDGMQVSSHTIHHVNVGNPPAWTSTQSELVLSKQTLQAQLNQPVQFFCYPSGEPFHHDTITQQQNVLTDLYNDGYVGATLDPFSLFTAVQNAQTPYQLNRIRVSGGESLSEFTGILNATLSKTA